MHLKESYFNVVDWSAEDKFVDESIIVRAVILESILVLNPSNDLS